MLLLTQQRQRVFRDPAEFGVRSDLKVKMRLGVARGARLADEGDRFSPFYLLAALGRRAVELAVAGLVALGVVEDNHGT